MKSGSDSVPTRARPATAPLMLAAAPRSASVSAITFSASGSRRLPAGVSVIPVGPRSNSGTPSSSSSALICAESAGWLTCSRSAARVRWPSSATAAKLRSW